MKHVSNQIVAVQSRRTMLALLAAGSIALPLLPRIARAQEVDEPDEASVLRDPEAPVTGKTRLPLPIVSASIRKA